MMKGMAIIEHLIGFLMQDFKKKIDMSLIGWNATKFMMKMDTIGV